MTYLRFLGHLRPWLALTIPLFIAEAGCQSSVEEKIALAQLAQNCLVNSDCSSPLVCAFEACHAECASSRDCEDGARCVAAARPFKVCQLEEERLCQRTTDCPEGLVCGVDGECRDQCLSDGQCVEGQRCVAGTCADEDELDDGGQLPIAAGATRGAEGSPCVYVSDCSEALLCRSQACLPECKADKDCPLHQVCSDTRCVPDGSQPKSCDYNSQCATDEGERCLAGACLCTCVENRDCPSGQLCNGCGCEPDPSVVSCVYNSDCKKPGEICKNRECACECKENEDCQSGQMCDGCGCVDDAQSVAGIVRGNVYIDSTLQLAGLRGVTEIHGALSIQGTSIPDLGDTFAKLTLVDGPLNISGLKNVSTLAFPELESVGFGSFSNAGVVSIELPKLQTGLLNFNGLPNLTQLSLGSYQSGELMLSQLPKLDELLLPALREVTILQLWDVPLVSELLLPELTTITSTLQLSSSTPSALATLTAPKLATLGVPNQGGSVTVDNTQLTSLASVGVPGFTSTATSVQLRRNPLMSSCASDDFLSHFPARVFTINEDSIPCAQPCVGAVCPE